MNQQVQELINRVDEELRVIVETFNGEDLKIDPSCKWMWAYDTLTEHKHLCLTNKDGVNVEDIVSDAIAGFNICFLHWQRNYNARANFAINRDTHKMEVLSSDIQLYRKSPPTAEEIEQQLKMAQE